MDYHIDVDPCIMNYLLLLFKNSKHCFFTCRKPGAKFTKHLRTILGQFYDILHTNANVLIRETSYDNFTTKILRSLFRCLMTFQFIRFHHHPTRKTSLYLFIKPLIQLYSQS